MVVDSSAIVACMLAEPNQQSLIDAIANDPVRIVSSVTLVEVTFVMEGRLGTALAAEVDSFLAALRATVVAFTEQQAQIARIAFRRYGKGLHPAALNFGDCCVYALAKDTSEPLLCTGRDFAQTDLTLVAF
jgi:ribonuclease VapC